MDTLHRELEALLAPTLDLEELERLATADERHALEDDCAEHDACRPIRADR